MSSQIYRSHCELNSDGVVISAVISVNRVHDKTIYSFIKIAPVRNPDYQEYHRLDCRFKREVEETMHIPNGIVI